MNVIEDMRGRLRQQFTGSTKPVDGFDVFQPPIAKERVRPRTFRPTANDMPRLPASNIPTPRPKYDTVGRPPKEKKADPLYRKKPRNIFGGWL